jgi:hypothetical protein
LAGLVKKITFYFWLQQVSFFFSKLQTNFYFSFWFLLADGKLLIKILKRTADFSKNLHLDEKKSDTGIESNFQIPKKTKIFVEQTIRERDNAGGN